MPHLSFLASVSLFCVAASAAILTYFLVARPPFGNGTKLALLLGLGIFPIGAALAGNVEGFEATKSRHFCGGCHLMTPYTSDAGNPNSGSLAARHGRNALFGGDNCYVCHADYGMFGTVMTKIGGMRHVVLNMTEYRGMSLAEARYKIHLRSPFPNQNCMQCHSTQNDLWLGRPDHRALLQDLRAGRIACASSGCHGYAHPFTKPGADSSGAGAEHAFAEERIP
jgi:cytochrome c-type protein NapC